jgi:hypothetical protein
MCYTKAMPLILKQYIIRKYILAVSAKHALRKEKGVPADECWIDEKWTPPEIQVKGFEEKPHKICTKKIKFIKKKR